MAGAPLDPDIVRLLAVAVESVERLEILLALRRAHPRSMTGKVLAHTLSISATSVDTHLAILCGRGFLGVTIGNDLVYTYKPISSKIERQVEDLADLWATRRRDVESMLAASSPSAASAFADAFRFRKKDRDG